MISVYQQGGHTTGDTLMAITMFNSLNQPVHITTGINSWYNTWKAIFDIGNQITLTNVQTCPEWLAPVNPELESFKVFNRYDQFDHVCLFGQTFPINAKRKKGAAILVNNGEYAKDDKFFAQVASTTSYPYTKFHTRETNDRILNLVQSAGYDPYYIDSKDITIDHKVFILNELCDFVIGYEGGMCHLAHALKIPAIILPWRVPLSNTQVTDFLHLDKKTYFIRNVKELESFNLTDTVEMLYNDGGNNQWLHTNDPTEFVKHYSSGSSKKFNDQLNWVLQYTNNPTLGGY
jgi:hypothetical protein